MSRRIALCILAASAALTAFPAFADRECFDRNCKLMPAVVEPPPAPVQAEPQALPQALPDVPPETEALAAEASSPTPAVREPVTQASQAREPVVPSAPVVQAPARREPAAEAPVRVAPRMVVYLIAPNARIITIETD
jgi:hypothetical protein